MLPPAPLLLAGTVVGGDFVVERPLDEGGMGAVFVATQRSTGKKRALKLMHRELLRDPLFVKRFEQEAKVGAQIASDHVVETVAAGVDLAIGLPYLVMELLEGEDLRTRIDTHGAISVPEAAEILEQLAHGLGAAHAASIVHRDLKPENVFLARTRRAGAGSVTVKLLDFGIARLAAEAATRSTRSAVGSPLWMAPEQTQPGAISPAADVWALGLVAYEMLTGRHFWRSAADDTATTAQLLREVVLDPIPPASVRADEQGVAQRVPPGFDAWFARCLAREPAARFANAGVAWSALAPVLSPTAGRPSGRQRTAFGDTVDVASSDPAATGDAGRVVVPAPSAAPFRVASSPPAVAPAQSAPPFPASMPPAPVAKPIPNETPIVHSHRTGDLPPTGQSLRGSRSGVALGLGVFAGLAVAGLAIAYAVRPPAPVASPPPLPAVASPTAPATASAIANATATAKPPAPAPAPAPSPVSSSPAPAPAPSPASSSPAPAPAPAPVSSSPKPRVLASGFSDPTDRNGPVQWKVQDRSVRLLTRLVSNESNVRDAEVRRAMEWSSWGYLRCYEHAFKAAKDLPEGVVTIEFDFFDQLPRNAKIVSSTIASPTLNECVRSTLVGQTFNAAGPEGKGHAALAFRFVPN